jgi:rhamnose transport system substrate-binding protein
MLMLTAVLVLSVVLAGCTQTAAPTAAPTQAATESGAAATGATKIVYIPKNTGNPYFDSIIKGFEKACGEIGCEFTTTAPATAEATSQIPFVREQIQRGVNVLAISPNSPDALNEVFDEARAKGITVLIVNSDIPGSEAHRDAAVLPMDFNITGSSQVELMGSLIDYEGEIAVLSATADAPDQNFWIEGMKEALKDPKYAKMKLVEVAYGNDDPQKSLTECEALLSKYPDLRGIIAPTTVGVAAAGQCSSQRVSTRAARMPAARASKSPGWAHPIRCASTSKAASSRRLPCGAPSMRDTCRATWATIWRPTR